MHLDIMSTHYTIERLPRQKLTDDIEKQGPRVQSIRPTPRKKYDPGPIILKMGPAKKYIVTVVAVRSATVLFAVTVESTWPEPQIPPRASHI